MALLQLANPLEAKEIWVGDFAVFGSRLAAEFRDGVLQRDMVWQVVSIGAGSY
jgi:hypothetical protein